MKSPAAVERATEAELADQIRAGSRAAFDRLVQEHWLRLVHYVADRVGDPELAKDIAQEVLLRIWARRAQINRQRSLIALLYRIAANLTTDALRSRGVRNRWTNAAMAAPAVARSSPLDRLVDFEQRQVLRRAIDALPQRRREAFTLVHVQGLSYDQAAQAMGNSRQTVANQVAAALAELRRNLSVVLGDGLADGLTRSGQMQMPRPGGTAS